MKPTAKQLLEKHTGNDLRFQGYLSDKGEASILAAMEEYKEQAYAELREDIQTIRRLALELKVRLLNKQNG